MCVSVCVNSDVYIGAALYASRRLFGAINLAPILWLNIRCLVDGERSGVRVECSAILWPKFSRALILRQMIELHKLSLFHYGERRLLNSRTVKLNGALRALRAATNATPPVHVLRRSSGDGALFTSGRILCSRSGTRRSITAPPVARSLSFRRSPLASLSL